MRVQLINQEFSLYFGIGADGSWAPHVVNDAGDVVPSSFDSFNVYANNEFKSITAAYEFHGLSTEPAPIPDLI